MKSRLFLLLLFSIFILKNNAFADCPSFLVSECEKITLGKNPLGENVYLIKCYNEMKPHFCSIYLITTRPDKLPNTIYFCSTSPTPISEKEVKLNFKLYSDENYEDHISYKSNNIVSFFQSCDGDIAEVNLCNSGRILTTTIFNGDIYGRSKSNTNYVTYSWDIDMENYLIIEDKSVDGHFEETSKIISLLKRDRLNEAISLMESYDFGEGRDGYAEVSFPINLIEEFLKVGHRQSLELYKSGKLKESGELSSKILFPNNGLHYLYESDSIRSTENSFASELLSLDKNLLPYISDLSFLLEQTNQDKLAIPIFQKILDVEPNRTVTMLNLADAFYKINENEKARAYYQKYVKNMELKGLKDKIPDYVFSRI